MRVQLGDLTDLLAAVKVIRKLSPNTGNGAAFRQGISEMTKEDMYLFCQAIDIASLCVGRLEHKIAEIND